MGQWGVKSYENDAAADALDAGFARVHAARYDALMDDDDPTPPEQVQRSLADPETLRLAIEALADEAAGRPFEEWDEVERLGLVGVVVLHAEAGVPIPPEPRERALAYLRDEPIDWDEATARRLRREKEIRLIEGGPG